LEGPEYVVRQIAWRTDEVWGADGVQAGRGVERREAALRPTRQRQRLDPVGLRRGLAVNAEVDRSRAPALQVGRQRADVLPPVAVRADEQRGRIVLPARSDVEVCQVIRA